MITREEWLDRLHELRVDLARLPDGDPRRADRQAVLDQFAAIEKSGPRWTNSIPKERHGRRETYSRVGSGHDRPNIQRQGCADFVSPAGSGRQPDSKK